MLIVLLLAEVAAVLHLLHQLLLRLLPARVFVIDASVDAGASVGDKYVIDATSAVGFDIVGGSGVVAGSSGTIDSIVAF